MGDLIAWDSLDSYNKETERKNEGSSLNCKVCSDKTTLKIISVLGI